MGKPNKVIKAFFELYQNLGSDAEPFINIEELWKQDGRLDSWKQSTEKHISQQYLPGFIFDDQEHFLWHVFKFDDPFVILRKGRKPETQIDLWIRRLFVSASTHYKSEIAFAMKNWEEEHAWKVKRMGNWDDSWSWTERVRNVLSIYPLQGGETAFDAKIEKGSIYRWERNAIRNRSERKSSNIPSGWKIDCIEFSEDQEYSHYPDHMTFVGDNSSKTGYRETWVWEPIPGAETPLDSIITFSAPASPDIWPRHWLSKRKAK